MAGSNATSSSFIFSTSSSSVLCCLGGWRRLKPSWLLTNFQWGQSERTDTGVGIPLPRPSPRPSLILFSCCAVSLAYCSRPCLTFQWGVGVGLGIPCWIFRCVSFLFWRGGRVVHFWWGALIHTWKPGWKSKLDSLRATSGPTFGSASK